MAAVSFDAITLVGQAGVHEVVSRPGAGAGGEHAGGGALPTGHHGELVGTGGSAVVQMVRGGVGLEGPTLVLGGARVGRGEVCVVKAGSRRHAGHANAANASGGGVGCVGEGCRHGPRVMHPGVGKPGLWEARQAGERAIKLSRIGEWA